MSVPVDRRYPYHEGPNGQIIVNPGWERDCPCRMNPCDVPWHYVNPAPQLGADAYRWTPGAPSPKG